MDVFTMLKEDHAKVRNLFKQYEACGDKELKKKQAIADTVFASLDTHTKVEEEILYPAISEKSDKDGKDLVNEAFEEHRLVKRLIKELKMLEVGDDQFEAKFKVLVENVEHHVQEEENELFPKAKKNIANEIVKISSDSQERKEELERKQTNK